MECADGEDLFAKREKDRIALSELFDHDPSRDEQKLSGEKKLVLAVLRQNLQNTGDAYAMHTYTCDACKHRP